MKHSTKHRNGLSVAHAADSTVRDRIPHAAAAAPARTDLVGAAGNAPSRSIVAPAPAPSARLTEPTTPARRPTHQEVERRAYELYLARKGRDGTAHDDWVRAERELSEGGLKA